MDFNELKCPAQKISCTGSSVCPCSSTLCLSPHSWARKLACMDYTPGLSGFPAWDGFGQWEAPAGDRRAKGRKRVNPDILALALSPCRDAMGWLDPSTEGLCFFGRWHLLYSSLLLLWCQLPCLVPSGKSTKGSHSCQPWGAYPLWVSSNPAHTIINNLPPTVFLFWVSHLLSTKI